MKFTSTWKISDPLAQYIIYLRKSRKDMEAEALGQTAAATLAHLNHLAAGTDRVGARHCGVRGSRLRTVKTVWSRCR